MAVIYPQGEEPDISKHFPAILDWLKGKLDLSMVKDSNKASRYAVSNTDAGGTPTLQGGTIPNPPPPPGTGVLSFNTRTGVVTPQDSDYASYYLGINANAVSASKLDPGAEINGVAFDGSSNVTVTAAAGTLTGTTLASNVTASSVTSVGTLTSLDVSGNIAAGNFSGSSSGTNTGDQTITLTGDVTGSGTGSFAATVENAPWSKVTGTPTTLAGYGITDAVENPMTTAGDIITGGTSGAPGRLAVGSSGQVLGITSGAPAWVTPAPGGSVTSVSVESANGLAGTVATPTTTPAITLETTVTGVLKGNGTAISAAVSGTDFSLGTSALGTGILKSTTSTGALTIAVASDFPTLNQDTTGSAGSLSPGADINGVAFDGSADITVTAAAGTLTGATLASGVTASSLTSVGTLEELNVTGNISTHEGQLTSVNTLGAALLGLQTVASPTSANPAFSWSISQGSQTDVFGNWWNGTTASNSVWSEYNGGAPTLKSFKNTLDNGAGEGTFAGSISASNFSGSSSGTNTGDQTITLTGDVTGSGTGSFAATVENAPWSKVTSTPTTLAGYGITDAVENPMTTAGDIITGGTSGAPARLGIGSAGQVLGITSGAPAWVTPAAPGTGTVTSVSVESANGLAGTVATPSTTPAITLSTSVTGMLKGNGTAISAATSGADYSAGTSALGTGIVKSTTGTGALSVAVAADFPLLNQDTTGNAATATLADTVTTNADLTGPVTSNGNATAVTANAITNAMLAKAPTMTVKGNNTATSADETDLTQAQLTAMVSEFTSTLAGSVPASGGGTTNYLRADGTWDVPASGSIAWGNITGTLSSQTDLQTALDDRAVLTAANIFTNQNTIQATQSGAAGASPLLSLKAWTGAAGVTSSLKGLADGGLFVSSNYLQLKGTSSSTFIYVFPHADGNTTNISLYATTGSGTATHPVFTLSNGGDARATAAFYDGTNSLVAWEATYDTVPYIRFPGEVRVGDISDTSAHLSPALKLYAGNGTAIKDAVIQCQENGNLLLTGSTGSVNVAGNLFSGGAVFAATASALYSLSISSGTPVQEPANRYNMVFVQTTNAILRIQLGSTSTSLTQILSSSGGTSSTSFSFLLPPNWWFSATTAGGALTCYRLQLPLGQT